LFNLIASMITLVHWMRKIKVFHRDSRQRIKREAIFRPGSAPGEKSPHHIRACQKTPLHLRIARALHWRALRAPGRPPGGNPPRPYHDNPYVLRERVSILIRRFGLLPRSIAMGAGFRPSQKQLVIAGSTTVKASLTGLVHRLSFHASHPPRKHNFRNV